MAKKWYVVVVGSEPGIYDTWIECAGKIKVSRPVYQSFETYEEAVSAYRGASQRGEVETRATQRAAGALSVSPTRIKHPLNSEEFHLELELDHASQRMNCVTRARTVQSSSTQWDDVSLLRSPSRTLPPSPPTGVTQYVELEDTPLYQLPRRLSPRVTVDDTSYTSSPLPQNSRPALIKRVQVSSMSSVEEMAETSPRPLRRQQTAPASFDTGARYPTLEEIREGQGLDPRVMLPPLRTFDPANVKPRPGASLTAFPHRKQLKNDQMDTELMTPHHATTHIMQNRLPAVSCPEADEISSASFLPPRRVVNKGKGRALTHAGPEVLPAFDGAPSNDRHLFSEYSHHVQEVYSADKPDQCSVVIVRCPPGSGCCHGHCGSVAGYSTTRSGGVPVQSQHVDAVISPIFSSVSSARDLSPRKTNACDPVTRVSNVSSEQGAHSFLGLSYTPQVPHRNYTTKSDVRSPLARGTRVPSGLSELSIFERPSPPIRGSLGRDSDVLMMSQA